MAPPNNSTVGNRAWVASRFYLDLDEVGGHLLSIDGGTIKAEVLNYQNAWNQTPRRQVGRRKIDDVTFTCPLNMGNGYYEWLAAFLNREIVRKSGALVGLDFNGKEVFRREFKEALISEVQFPALDAGQHQPAVMTVKIVAEDIEFKAGDGERASVPMPQNDLKLWLQSQFTFTLDGVDAFAQTTKVDAITVKQNILEYPSGNLAMPIRIPGKYEIPNLTVYIPTSDATPLYEYANNRLVKFGEEPGKKTAALTYIGPDDAELAYLEFDGVEITSVEPEKFDAKGQELHRTKVQMLVESVAFSLAE